MNSRFFGAVSAAIDRPAGLYAMAQDSAVAMRAARREFVNCAFKAVERMILSAENNIKGFVIVVAAGFALSHGSFLP